MCFFPWDRRKKLSAINGFFPIEDFDLAAYDFDMPTKTTRENARRAAREGKKPTTQAGEYIREEMHKMKNGSGNVRSREQAIAIGLSEARREGLKLGVPSGRLPAATRRKAEKDSAIASGREKVSPSRSTGAKKAARTRGRRYARSS